MKKALADKIGDAYLRILKRRKEQEMDLKEYGKKWVAKNLGKEHVEEFEQNYDNFYKGVRIGGFVETAIFLDLLENISRDKESGVEV